MSMSREIREFGQGLVEYALIIFLLAVGLIAALNFLGDGVVAAFYNNILEIL